MGPAPHLDGAEVFDDALTGRRRVTIPVALGFDLVVEWNLRSVAIEAYPPGPLDLVDRFGRLEPRPDRLVPRVVEPPEV